MKFKKVQDKLSRIIVVDTFLSISKPALNNSFKLKQNRPNSFTSPPKPLFIACQERFHQVLLLPLTTCIFYRFKRYGDNAGQLVHLLQGLPSGVSTDMLLLVRPSEP